MMTIGDPEGQIFLSHAHTNNGFLLAQYEIPNFIFGKT